MSLDSSIINAFAEQVTSTEDLLDVGEYYNGTVKIQNGVTYVQLDGSTQITPVASSSVGVKDGNRVSCTIKNHKLSIVGNMSDPAVNTTEVDAVKTKIVEVNTLLAEKVSTSDFEAKIADIENLKADKATIDDLKADMLTVSKADIRYAKVDDLKATDAEITNIKAGMLTADAAAAKYATIDNLKATNETVTNLQGTYATFEKTTTEQLKANQAAIDHLDADKLDANDAEIKYATIKNLDAANANISSLETKQASFETATANNFSAVNANIETLRTDKLDAASADLKYANIDFVNITEAAVKKIFSDSGIIKDLVVDEGKITGELVGVTIKGDLIEGGTVVADKLVVKGSNGLYYKLNTDGVTTEAEQTEYNSLNGSVITAKSITATKINVSDLVAFGATIAGYTIKDHALYSGSKTSATNTTRGVYMNDSGEFSVGDANNYIRFWQDADGKYKLALSASSIVMSSSGKTVESAINEATSKADAAQSAADAASTAASEAQSTADSASTTASNAQISADKAQQDVTSLATTVGEVRSSFEQSMNGFKQTVEENYATIASVEQLQNIADSAIETWTGSGAPSDTKPPTSSWSTATLKKQHSGDVYYDTDSGYSYRYGSSDGTNYSWVRIKDSDITSAMDKATSALENAQTAQTTADTANTAAGKAQTTADNAQKDLDNYKNAVTSTYVTKTIFEQTSKSITSSVESVKTTAESASTAATKAQQTADSIDVNLSKNYMTSSQVNSAIDDISIGGRNLLLGTGIVNTPSKMAYAISNGNVTVTDQLDSTGASEIECDITKTGNATNDYCVLLYPISSAVLRGLVSDQSDENISVEFKIYASTEFVNRNININIATPSGTYNLASFGAFDLGPGEPVAAKTIRSSARINKSVEVNGQYLCINVGKLAGSLPIGTTGKIFISHLKLEYGNKPTDWTPAPEDLQPAGDYATNAQLNATADSITASVSSVKTIASNAQTSATTANSKIDNLKVGGRNLLLGTGVSKTVTGKGTTNQTARLYSLTKSLYGLDVKNNPMCESIEFMIDSEPKSNSVIRFQYSGPYYGYYAGSSHTLTSDDVGKYVKMTIVNKKNDFSGVTESNDADAVFIRLDNYTGNVTVRNAKFEYGTTATDWSPAPEDLATTTDVDSVKEYSDAQLKMLSDNISTLVTDAAGKSMMTQTSTGWTFDMSTIQNGISANADSINSVAGNLSNVESTVNGLNSQVKNLLDTSAYISIGTDDNGDPRLELGKKDSSFKVAISNTSIDFLEGTDKIAYISNKQLYIYSSVVTDELKIGDSTGYIWKRRANNHLGLRYVTGGVVNPNELEVVYSTDWLVGYYGYPVDVYDAAMAAWGLYNSSASTERYCNTVDKVCTIESGVTYTLSFEMAYNASITRPIKAQVYILDYSPSVVIPFSVEIAQLTEAFTKYAYTFTYTGETISCYFRFDNDGSSVDGSRSCVYLRYPKLERGDKATG